MLNGGLKAVKDIKQSSKQGENQDRNYPRQLIFRISRTIENINGHSDTDDAQNRIDIDKRKGRRSEKRLEMPKEEPPSPRAG